MSQIATSCSSNWGGTRIDGVEDLAEGRETESRMHQGGGPSSTVGITSYC